MVVALVIKLVGHPKEHSLKYILDHTSLLTEVRILFHEESKLLTICILRAMLGAMHPNLIIVNSSRICAYNPLGAG